MNIINRRGTKNFHSSVVVFSLLSVALVVFLFSFMSVDSDNNTGFAFLSGNTGNTYAARSVNTSLFFNGASDVTLRSFNISDDVIYSMGYVSYSGHAWKPFNITPLGNSSGGWIRGSGIANVSFTSAKLHLNMSRPSSDNTYIIILTCSKNSATGDYDCHNGWQKIRFRASINSTFNTSLHCNDSYHPVAGSCVSNTYACNGSASQDCTSSIANAASASRSRTCVSSAGVWSAYGNCIPTTCNSGFTVSGNSCVPITLTCSGSNTESCTTAAFAVTASRTRTCDNSTGEWSAPYGECIPTACNVGYHIENNTCVIDTVSNCTGSSTEACGINFGSGSRAHSCNTATGVWGAPYGNCTVVSCNSGYKISGNSCVSAVISCIGSSNESCTSIANAASATRTHTCNTTTGTWGAPYGTCTVVSCSSGYTKSGNTCVATVLTCTGNSTQSCTSSIAYAASASQSRTCNTATGVWNTYGTCTLSTCNSGYTKSGNTCVASNANCMTAAQVQAYTSGCLYIYQNTVYKYGSISSPHHHPCGTDVTSSMPSNHKNSPSIYLTPFIFMPLC